MKAFLEEYARQVGAGLFINRGVDPVAHVALGIAGEAGECADLVKKSQYAGNRLDIERLHEELGDLLWYLTAMTELTGITLDALMKRNIAKLEKRYKYAAVYNLARLVEAEDNA